MVEATFIASGNSAKDALDMAAVLAVDIMMGEKNFILANKLDIYCDNIDDANTLDTLLWNNPKYSILDHGLVNNGSGKLIEIGYPGTKFSLKSDSIINVSPDIPKNLDTYQSYLQLVVMDGSSLRKRAADTWTKCKELGLNAKFLESI